MQVFAFDIRQKKKKKRILNMRGFSVVVLRILVKPFSLRDKLRGNCVIVGSGVLRFWIYTTSQA